jgi:3-oxoacyl-[acyl-carrier protein] reductase
MFAQVVTKIEDSHLAGACMPRGVIGSDFQKQLIAQTPLGRFGQLEDMARVAVLLASDAAGRLTGEILHAPGGAR